MLPRAALSAFMFPKTFTALLLITTTLLVPETDTATLLFAYTCTLLLPLEIVVPSNILLSAIVIPPPTGLVIATDVLFAVIDAVPPDVFILIVPPEIHNSFQARVGLPKLYVTSTLGNIFPLTVKLVNVPTDVMFGCAAVNKVPAYAV